MKVIFLMHTILAILTYILPRVFSHLVTIDRAMNNGKSAEFPRSLCCAIRVEETNRLGLTILSPYILANYV